MGRADGTCEYVLDPTDPGTWDGADGEPCRLPAELLNDEGVWACPHDAPDGSRRCLFHQPVDQKRHADVAAALADALREADREGRRRAAAFVGGRFERVVVDPGTTIDAPVRFDHASVETGLAAADVAFAGGITARGLEVGTGDADGHAPSGDVERPPLESVVGSDHHGRFPRDDGRDGRHVSFCGATFDGRVAFDGAVVAGPRHVSFAHADFAGDADVSFDGLDARNRGHVAFNKADFRNGGNVTFDGAAFRNGDVSLSVTDFENGGDASFESVAFRDGGDVAVHDGDFVNEGGVWITDIVLDGVDALDFSGTTFTEDVAVGVTAVDGGTVRFVDADLSGAALRIESLPQADFGGANLSGVDLSGVDLSGANLERARLAGTDLFGADLSGARLHGTRIGGTRVNTETVFDRHGDDRCVYDPKSAYTYDESGDGEAVGRLRKAMGTYHVFERLTRDNTLPDRQARFFARRQDMRRAQLRRDGRRLDYGFAAAQNAVFRHGESFSRVVGWSLGTILTFALLYPLGGWLESGATGPVTYGAVADSPVLLWKSLHHSALLFLTGSGPLDPVDTVGELLVTAEAAVAPVLLALLVFVLGRRAAR